MKIFTIGNCFAAAAMMATSLTLSAATDRVGMLIGYESAENSNPQESAAAKWFLETYTDGVLITPSQIDKINTDNISTLWVHIDRVGIGHGFDRLPAEFNNSQTMIALSNFVEEGGSLYLSKFATQMVHALGRIPAEYAPGIFGDGDGGTGNDVWTVNAYFGSMQNVIENGDLTQIYDRRNHPIYEGLEAFEAYDERTPDYPHSSFPMEGAAVGQSLHREDHNCMWDLNAYSWSVEGKNTLEMFEAQFDCTTLGTWGHVQDYCVAGIVEFEPTATIKGRIIANGLAACEWAPRSGVNVYHDNLLKLTENTLDYLASKSTVSGVKVIEEAQDSTPVYYNLQGVRVENPAAGVFIKVEGNKTSKVMIK